ncbi:MAG: hypothetical protein K8S98_03500 [Planctomycetes bacterium]|nr:hypothetical protein [Planctomycetota bacterium]
MTRFLLALSALALATACHASHGSTTASTERVFVVEGCVAHPGAQTWDADTTVFEAVRRAEPVTAECDLSRVTLVRYGSNAADALTIDVQRMLDSGDSTQNALVHAGDVIVVPAKSTR